MDKKTSPMHMASTRDPPQINDAHRLKIKDGKKYFMQMEIKIKAEIATLISDKTYFITKATIRDKKDFT